MCVCVCVSVCVRMYICKCVHTSPQDDNVSNVRNPAAAHAQNKSITLLDNQSMMLLACQHWRRTARARRRLKYMALFRCRRPVLASALLAWSRDAQSRARATRGEQGRLLLWLEQVFVCVCVCVYVHTCYVLTKPPIPSSRCKCFVVLRPV